MIDLTVVSFYMFAAILLMSAGLVISVRNTVHSVLFLILAFFNAAGLFVLLNAELLAMMLVVVYVGAVAVLFLFVVMMLNVDMRREERNIRPYLAVAGLVGGILLIELELMAVTWMAAPEAQDLMAAPLPEGHISNAKALGNLLYTHYAFVFIGSGLILLVAMVGAISLTLRTREGVKKQNIYNQLARNPKESVTLVDVPVGKGVEI